MQDQTAHPKIRSLCYAGINSCSLDDFKQHFQSKFKEGMMWSKLLTGEIHIDHVIPCADFDLSQEEEQKRCFHFTNLQPL